MENVRKHKDIMLLATNKKYIFIGGTKLSYDKNVFRKFIANRNEKNKNKNEYASISRLVNIRY